MTKHDTVSEAANLFRSHYGKSQIQKVRREYFSLSTGSLALDHALGTGGVPKGTILEILGAESTGKTALALHMVRNAQQAGWRCLWVDLDYRFNPDQARSIGVALAKLRFIVEQDDVRATRTAIGSAGDYDLLIIDSLAHLIREDTAWLVDLKQILNELEIACGRHGTIAVLPNQIRSQMKRGILGWHVRSAGGTETKKRTDMRVWLERREVLKDCDEPYGLRIGAKVLKNREGDASTEAEFDLLKQGGISREAELTDLGRASGILEQQGSYYTYQGKTVAQGRTAMIQLLIRHPELRDELGCRIAAILFPNEETEQKEESRPGEE